MRPYPKYPLNSVVKMLMTCRWIAVVYLDLRLFVHNVSSPITPVRMALRCAREWWSNEADDEDMPEFAGEAKRLRLKKLRGF